MGQNLAIGIITKIHIAQKEAKKHEISFDEISAAMRAKHSFNPDIYDVSDADDYWTFTMKPDIWEAGLIPLLEDAYAVFSAFGGDNDFDEALEAVRITPPNIDGLTEMEGHCAFQFDRYGMSTYLYFDKPFRPKVILSFDAVILHLCGKVYFEETNGMLNLFTHTLQHRLQHLTLATALRVYVTG